MHHCTFENVRIFIIKNVLNQCSNIAFLILTDSGSDGEGGSSSKVSKKERYFWQYNVQSKGPKGQRLILKTQQEDPHCLNEITDPVFSPDCSLQGIKHRSVI